MQMNPDAELSVTGLVHPRVEPEVAFRLKTALSGTPTTAQALAAVGSVHPAIEVIDSRYTDFKFTLIDVIADNTSACRFVLGPGRDPAGLNLGDLAMTLDVGGREKRAGSSAAILEHPAASLARLATMLSSRGEGLAAGAIVLAGAATAAVHAQAGDRVVVQVESLGSVAFTMVE
jgi:2-oxo-3-hexenedioate decarboxylase